MKKSFKYKLYYSRKNRHIHRLIDVAGEIYNHCIALHKRYYRLTGKHLNVFMLKKHITKLKHLKKHEHWGRLGSQAVQDVVIRIEKNYHLFFKSLNTGRRGCVSPPGFKKRRKYKSFTLTQAGYKILEGNRIKIGQHVFKYHKSRDIQGTVKTLTIKRDSLGDIYMIFSCDRVAMDAQDRAMTGKSAGSDFGLHHYLTISDGGTTESPEFFKQGMRAVQKASRNLSRKKKGSHNRSRARMNLARIHRKVSNQRLDFNMKLARQMAKRYDYLFFEDLNIDAMKKLWGRKVSDMGFADYLRLQEHMCSKFGTVMGKIDRFYPSSKQCHVCGSLNADLDIKDREWVCPSCKTGHDRDINAAIVIHMVGASNHWERSSKTADVSSSNSASIPESHML
jgi:putative transposase